MGRPVKIEDTEKNNDKGFTLIEVMTGMFILAVGVMGLVSMFETSMRANTNARNMTAASLLVARHMEAVKGVAFNSVVNNILSSAEYTNKNSVTVGNKTTLTADYKESGDTLNAANFTLTLIRVEDDPIVYIDKVVARVSWNDRFGDHSSTAVTYIESLT